MEGSESGDPLYAMADDVVDRFLENGLLSSELEQQVRALRSNEGAYVALEKILEERET